MVIRSENGGQIKSNGGLLFGQRYVKQPNIKSLVNFLNSSEFLLHSKVIRKILDLNNVFPAKNTLSEKKGEKRPNFS